MPWEKLPQPWKKLPTAWQKVGFHPTFSRHGIAQILSALALLIWLVEKVGEQRDEFGTFAFLDVHINDYSGYMVDIVLAEHHYLLTIFHKALRSLLNTVHKYVLF